MRKGFRKKPESALKWPESLKAKGQGGKDGSSTAPYARRG